MSEPVDKAPAPLANEIVEVDPKKKPRFGRLIRRKRKRAIDLEKENFKMEDYFSEEEDSVKMRKKIDEVAEEIELEMPEIIKEFKMKFHLNSKFI